MTVSFFLITLALSSPLAITQGSLGPLDEKTSNPYENESPSDFLREHILTTLAEKTLPDYYKILDELIEDQSDGQFSEEETEDLDDIKDLVEDLDGKIKDLVEHLVKDDQDLIKGDQDQIEGDQNVVEGDQDLVKDLNEQDLVEDLDYDIKDLVEHLVKGDQDIGDEMEESGEVDDQFDGTDDQLEDRNDQFEDTDYQFEDTDDKFEDTNDQFEDTDDQFEDTDDQLKDTDDQLEDLKDQLEDTNDQFEATINQLKDLWGLKYYQNDEDAVSKKVDDQFEGTDDQFENAEDQFEDAYDHLEDTDEQFEDLSGLKEHEKDEDAVSKNRFKRSPFFNPLNFLRKQLKGRFHPQLRPNLPYVFISQGRPRITSTGAIQHHTGVDPRAIVYGRSGVAARLPRPRYKK